MPGVAATWIRPPRLRTQSEQERERHATWYELFFDLVFVAAVAQLATALSREPTQAGFLRFAGLFVPIACKINPATIQGQHQKCQSVCGPVAHAA